MLLSPLFTNRNADALPVNWQKSVLFNCVFLFALGCWMLLLGRIVTRSISIDGQPRQMSASRIPASSESRRHEIDDIDECFEIDDQICYPANCSSNTSGLVLESTLISGSQQIAQICGERVEQGSTATIRGLIVQIVRIHPHHVILKIAGKSATLPLLFDEQREDKTERVTDLGKF